MKERVDKLIEELEMINKQSFGMACSIHKEPALLAQSGEKARLVIKRLLDIAKELKRTDPAAHQQWFHPISESFLDLQFIEEETGAVSLRFGDLRKWG